MKTCPECDHPLPHGPLGCCFNMSGKLGYSKIECSCKYGVGGTRKVADLPDPPHPGWTHRKEPQCLDRDHRPDKRGLAPGIYEHTCPTCGDVTRFRVERSTL